jgi:hypothetical protein
VRHQAPDPKHPVVCFDESPTQLIGEVREPIRARSGQIERYDCEYKRNGMAIERDYHGSSRRLGLGGLLPTPRSRVSGSRELDRLLVAYGKPKTIVGDNVLRWLQSGREFTCPKTFAVGLGDES